MSHTNENEVIKSVGDIKILVEKAKKGDHASFAALYNIYLTPLYRYVFSRTKDKDKSDDIVQKVFLKWYESLPRYELRHSPLQYLFVIARNEIIDEGSRKETVPLPDEDIFSDEKSLEEEIDVHLTVERIIEELGNLPYVDQEIINLHFFAELSTKEMSEILGKKEDNIRQMKVRALARLKKHLQNLHEKNI